ncbi:hypothetical protein Fmac_001473 [Flemingia macrophylla]|uniref:Uncharacterized protein n=1 Tax=Flemingia macrophylla TaxID=520843 RepID=A0ABD1NH68_9FABA
MMYTDNIPSSANKHIHPTSDYPLQHSVLFIYLFCTFTSSFSYYKRRTSKFSFSCNFFVF